MTFIVNGADWRFDGMSEKEVEDKIEGFLKFVSTSQDRDETVQIGDDFQERAMLGSLTLWEMLYKVSLPKDTRDEMISWLGRPKYYTEWDDRPNGFDDIKEVSVGECEERENADVAWVHHCVREGIVAACVTLAEGGPRETRTSLGSATVRFVKKDKDRKLFWRDAISLNGDGLNCLMRYAPHAYPNICFVDGVLCDLDTLDGGYIASSCRVQHTLAQLDDWGKWVFSCPPPAVAPTEDQQKNNGSRPSNQLMKKRFLGLGLDAAPENPIVKKNRNCRNAREAEIGGRILYCEWHIKLERHRNRIYIHRPVRESCDKVVVGMIADHLPLP